MANLANTLPFSARTTAAAAVFTCIFVAAPQGAQRFAAPSATIGALSLEYSQLLSVYALLIHQDTANNLADLTSAINTAVTVVGNLNATMLTIPSNFINAIPLAAMKLVVANALASVTKAQTSITEDN